MSNLAPPFLSGLTHTQGRFSNMLQGVTTTFPNVTEDFNDTTVGPGEGFGIGIHGYGGTRKEGGQQVMIGNSHQVNTTQHDGRVSLRFGNVGNYQRHHPAQDSTDVAAGGPAAKPRKKAGKLYKPFHSGVGGTSSVPATRRDRLQSRQGQVPGQRQSNVQRTAGRRWESSTYSQQAQGATFYDLLKHNTRSARAQQQTVTLLGDSKGVKLPPI